jgi:hypothetical protein
VAGRTTERWVELSARDVDLSAARVRALAHALLDCQL